jgi:putative ATPase
VIAKSTKGDFCQINATTAGKKDITDTIEKAKERLGGYGKKTILFIDEIHRFNKTQQDTLLPFVEDGTIVLVGATTENPYFEVNKALVSRSIIFELKCLSKDNLKTIIKRALTDKNKGLGIYDAVITDDALDFIADTANGDARVALNAIEIGVLTTDKKDGKIIIDIDVAQQCIQKRVLNYDKDGDNHYDTISAFIKSMRGSDPDAAVYYLAKMLYAGEDPKFIARRIMICASEDVGNADPMALVVATSAMQAVQVLGMPECRINLSQAAIYVACAAKSNAAIMAVDNAMSDVRSVQTSGVPNHLRDRHYPGAVELGHGDGYKYAHDYEDNYVEQQYLPDELVGKKYYNPTTNGYEKRITDRLNYLKNRSVKYE